MGFFVVDLCRFVTVEKRKHERRKTPDEMIMSPPWLRSWYEKTVDIARRTCRVYYVTGRTRSNRRGYATFTRVTVARTLGR